MTELRFKRVLLKLSGEILAADKKYGIDPEFAAKLVTELAEVVASGVQLGITIGGGNIFRGVQADQQKLERVSGDYMGMLATVINALALQDLLEQRGVPTRVMSAIEMREVCEPYIRRRALRHMEKGRVVIFAAGIGNPYFTTDTSASLRAMEVNAEVLLKGTKVDAVYDSDPKKNLEAKPFSKLTYLDVLKKELKIMDAAAISLCMDNKLPIIVFNVGVRGNLQKILSGENIGTLVSAD